MSLQFRILQDVVLGPVRPIPERLQDPKFATPAFSNTGNPLTSFCLQRSYGSGKTQAMSEIGNYVSPTRIVEQNCIYGGYWDHQFGHFLLESLARLWVTDEYKTEPIYFHGGNTKQKPFVASWQRDALKILGIDMSRINFIMEYTEFRKIILPSPGYIIADYFSRKHAEFLARLHVERSTASMVWLSRSELSTRFGRIIGEKKLEEVLSSAGWQVIYPERMTLEHQLAVISQAKLVAGIEGSALHSVILLGGNIPNLRIIPRRIKNHPVSRNYLLIAETKGIDQKIWREGLFVEVDRGYRSDFRIENIDQISDFLLS